MKIALAQIRSQKGDIAANIATHIRCILFAIEHETDVIFFPELSITGYEPTLAATLATTAEDARFEIFQQLSHTHHITIGVGFPVKTATKPQIGMAIFRPQEDTITYSKQILHPDEYPYFATGSTPCFFNIENINISVAICYESLQEAHNQYAAQQRTSIYIASVAKSEKGVQKAHTHYSTIAPKYNMTVLMVNNIGASDDFVAAGQSAIWHKDGARVAALNANIEGILLFDTDTHQTFVTAI